MLNADARGGRTSHARRAMVLGSKAPFGLRLLARFLLGWSTEQHDY